MNQIEAITTVLSFTLSILGIWWIVFWLFRDYRVDSFRQQMFALRDELFDEAATGKFVTFDHPAYGLLRSTINGFIRFGHRISLSQILLTLLVVRPQSLIDDGYSFSEKWARATKDLDFEPKGRLEEFSQRMNAIVIRHTILSSPVLLLTVITPILFWVLAQHCWDQIVQLIKSPLDGLDSVAMVEGQ